MNQENLNLGQLYEVITALQKRLEGLEKKSGQEPPTQDNVVYVTGSIDLPRINTAEITLEKLVELYQEVPQILVEYAINVHLTAESYRNKDRLDKIILEKHQRGKYWAICLAQGYKLEFWLVPNGKITFNPRTLKSAGVLFDLEGEISSQVNEFLLLKPARLSQPNGDQWRLEEKGILQFGNSAFAARFPGEIARVDRQLDSLSTELREVSQQFQKLWRFIELVEAKLDQERQVRNDQEAFFEGKLQELQAKLTQLEQQSGQKTVKKTSGDRKPVSQGTSSQNQSPKEQPNQKPESDSAGEPFTDFFGNIFNRFGVNSVSSQPESSEDKLTGWQNLELLHTLNEHTGSVRALAVGYSTDFNCPLLASGGLDNSIKIWNLAAGKLIKAIASHTIGNAICFAPDGKTLICGSDDSAIQIWPLGASDPIWLEGHKDRILAIAVSRDGRFLASGSRDHTIKIWDLSTQRLVASVEEECGTFLSLGIHSDGETLVSTSGDKTIRLWELRSGKLKTILHQHTDLVWSIALSEDGKTLISGCRDRTVEIWDILTQKRQHSLQGHQGAVWSVAVSPDNQVLASGSADSTIKLWNLKSGALIRTLNVHQQDVYAVAISSDGQFLASGSRDASVKICRVKSS